LRLRLSLLLPLLLLLLLARGDNQVSEGVSDLFPSLLIGHDGIARSSSSSASVTLLGCFLLEESSTDLFVEHPNNRLDHIGFVFTSRRVNIPLKVHLDGDSESSVTDVVVSTAVASTNNIIWSGFGNHIAVVETIHVVHIAGEGIHGHIVVHAVVHNIIHAIVVEAKSVEIVAIHDVGGGVDDGRSRTLHCGVCVLRVVGVITDHTAAAH